MPVVLAGAALPLHVTSARQRKVDRFAKFFCVAFPLQPLHVCIPVDSVGMAIVPQPVHVWSSMLAWDLLLHFGCLGQML